MRLQVTAHRAPASTSAAPANRGKAGALADATRRSGRRRAERPEIGENGGSRVRDQQTSRSIEAGPLTCPAPTVSAYPRTHKSREVEAIRYGIRRPATRRASLMANRRSEPISARRPVARSKRGYGSLRPRAAARTRGEWKAGLSARRPSCQTGLRRAELRKWRISGLRAPTRRCPASVIPRVSRQSPSGSSGASANGWRSTRPAPAIGTIEALRSRACAGRSLLGMRQRLGHQLARIRVAV